MRPTIPELDPAAAQAPLVRRQHATQATLDAFRGKLFSWSGQKTCLHLMHAHLVNCGVKVPRLPAVRSPLSAKKALARRKCANMAEVLDSLGLERLPAPAMMTIGDLAFGASEDGFGSIAVCVGSGQLLGWTDRIAQNAEEEGQAVQTCEVLIMSLDQVDAAWRVPL